MRHETTQKEATMPVRSGMNENEPAEVIGETQPDPGLPARDEPYGSWLTVLCGVCQRNIAMHTTLVLIGDTPHLVPSVSMVNYDGDDRGQPHRCAGE
jgi:hypothetical protein